MNIKRQKIEKEETALSENRIIEKDLLLNPLYNLPYLILRCDTKEKIGKKFIKDIFMYIKVNFLRVCDIWNCFRAFTFSKEGNQLYCDFNDICTFCWKKEISKDMKQYPLLTHHANNTFFIKMKDHYKITYKKNLFACFKCFADFSSRNVYISFK